MDSSAHHNANELREQALAFVGIADEMRRRDLTTMSAEFLQTYCLKLLQYISEMQWCVADLIEKQPLLVLMESAGAAESPENTGVMPAELELPPFEMEYFFTDPGAKND